jgi:hypothetical protein
MRCVRAAFAALCLLAVAAPAAQSDHVTPSVTATLELGEAVRDCSLHQGPAEALLIP